MRPRAGDNLAVAATYVWMTLEVATLHLPSLPADGSAREAPATARDRGWRLGEWRVEPELLRLTRRGPAAEDAHAGVVHLEPRVMELLVRFLERPGAVLGKQELLAEVWGDTAVSEVALPRCISDLRRALGDDARDPRYIETISKRGYRLIATVEPPPAAVRPAAAGGAVAATPDAGPAPSTTRRRGGRVLLGVAALVVVTAAFALAVWSLGRPLADHGQSLAVVPLRDLSPEPSPHFAGSLTELLATRLAQLPGQRVVAADRAGISATSTAEVARSLGVDRVLDGSILRDGDTVRVTLQLVDARTGEYLWATTAVATGRDVVGLQGAIVDEVAVGLAAALAP